MPVSSTKSVRQSKVGRDLPPASRSGALRINPIGIPKMLTWPLQVFYNIVRIFVQTYPAAASTL